MATLDMQGYKNISQALFEFSLDLIIVNHARIVVFLKATFT